MFGGSDEVSGPLAPARPAGLLLSNLPVRALPSAEDRRAPMATSMPLLTAASKPMKAIVRAVVVPAGAVMVAAGTVVDALKPSANRLGTPGVIATLSGPSSA